MGFYYTSTDLAYLENEERLKSVAPTPTASSVQALRSYWVSIGSLDECIWRHQSNFQISTFNAHKQPQTCGGIERLSCLSCQTSKCEGVLNPPVILGYQWLVQSRTAG